MKQPSFRTYGHYNSSNYGAHCMLFYHNPTNTCYYFSYKTLVAFNSPKTGLVVHKNIWGPTTGKHLNWISEDRSIRVDGEEFERLYKKAHSK